MAGSDLYFRKIILAVLQGRRTKRQRDTVGSDMLN